MNLVDILFLGLALPFLRFLAGLLVGQQIKGSIPQYTAARARAAARCLPRDLAKRYEEEWLASLEVLADKPLSAIKYAHGLRRAAKSIAADPSPAPEPGARRKATRVADSALGFLLLVLLSPLVLALSIAVMAAGGRPILRRTVVFGMHGRRVSLLSFRSRDRDDRGFTAVGKWMHRTGLAELPVLINLIRGEIAVIGSPPLRPIGVKMSVPHSSVRPGLISWQRMARVGYVDVGIDEARARDERRNLKNDIELALRWPGFVVSGAELEHDSGSYCDCGMPSNDSQGRSNHKPPE